MTTHQELRERIARKTEALQKADTRNRRLSWTIFYLSVASFIAAVWLPEPLASRVGATGALIFGALVLVTIVRKA